MTDKKREIATNFQQAVKLIKSWIMAAKHEKSNGKIVIVMI